MSETIHDRIRRLVAESGMTFAEVEARGGMPKQALTHILKRRGDITTRTLDRLAAGLGVSRDVIIEGDDLSLAEARLLAAFRRLDQRSRALVLDLGERLLEAPASDGKAGPVKRD